LINNRQAGRRRGRNNPRQSGGGGNRGNGDSGNRIDNRARGNAAQLLEKYRNLARDSQLSGDRVNVEYYLQFADHYFRVLADNRARQEEQQQRFRRNDDGDQFAYDGPDDGDDMNGDDMDDGFGPPGQFQHPPQQPQPQQERRPRADDQQERRPRADEQRERRPERQEREPREPRRRDDRPRRDARVANDDGDENGGASSEGLSLAALPPSISRPEPSQDSGAGEPAAQDAPAKPRRGRPRKTPEAAE